VVALYSTQKVLWKLDAKKGNTCQKTETLMYFLNRSSIFIKIAASQPHRPGGIRLQIKVTLDSGCRSVLDSEGSCKADWQQITLVAVQWKLSCNS